MPARAWRPQARDRAGGAGPIPAVWLLPPGTGLRAARTCRRPGVRSAVAACRSGADARGARRAGALAAPGRAAVRSGGAVDTDTRARAIDGAAGAHGGRAAHRRP